MVIKKHIEDRIKHLELELKYTHEIYSIIEKLNSSREKAKHHYNLCEQIRENIYYEILEDNNKNYDIALYNEFICDEYMNMCRELWDVLTDLVVNVGLCGSGWCDASIYLNENFNISSWNFDCIDAY